jgi:hypothetical protein
MALKPTKRLFVGGLSHPFKGTLLCRGRSITYQIWFIHGMKRRSIYTNRSEKKRRRRKKSPTKICNEKL